MSYTFFLLTNGRKKFCIQNNILHIDWFSAVLLFLTAIFLVSLCLLFSWFEERREHVSSCVAFFCRIHCLFPSKRPRESHYCSLGNMCIGGKGPVSSPCLYNTHRKPLCMAHDYHCWSGDFSLVGFARICAFIHCVYKATVRVSIL